MNDKIDIVRLTIVYDNASIHNFLKPDWGFACVITGDNLPNILFDTGANGEILIHNMLKLAINPEIIDMVFLSHHHLDHTGGLSHFLNRNSNVDICVPISLRGIHGVRNLIRVQEPKQIGYGMYSTGELASIEQSLILNLQSGLLVVTGCSHPPMKEILSASRIFGGIYGIIGGFHSFSELELFQDLRMICPVHCTEQMEEIRTHYPDTCVEGGAGKVFILQ